MRTITEKTKLCILLLTLCFALKAHPQVYFHDETTHLNYKLDTDTKEATVGTGTNDRHNALYYPPIGDPWWDTQTPFYWSDVVIPQTIEYEGEKYTVTEIGTFAFSYITGVKSVKIPETVRNISFAAFYFCISITDVNMPNQLLTIGDAAFQLCRGLTKIHLPEGVRSIGASAFSDCAGLAEIHIPSSCESIGNEAFTWCKSLKKVTIADSPTPLHMGYNYNIGLDYDGPDKGAYRGLFADCPIKELYLGRLFTYEIDKYKPFYKLSNYGTNTSGVKLHTGLTFDTVTFGNYFTKIDSELFYGCYFNNELVFPETLKTIGEKAFYPNAGLNQRKLIFPASLESIGDYAFSNADLLRIIVCKGNTPPTIAESTFHNGNFMVEVPTGKTSAYRQAKYWSNYAFIDDANELLSVNVKTPGTLLSRLLAQGHDCIDIARLKITGSLNDDDWAAFSSMTNLYELDASGLSITEFPEKAFSELKYLTSIKLPSTLSKINDNEFTANRFLGGDLVIPHSCKSIGKRAFVQKSFSSLKMPENIVIGEYAFAMCLGIDEVRISGKGSSVGEEAFYNSSVRKVYIGDNVILGKSAFLYNKQLEYICIGDNVSMPEGDANSSVFGSCNSVKRIDFNGAVSNKRFNFKLFANDDPIITDFHIYDLDGWVDCEPENDITYDKYYEFPLDNAKNVYHGDEKPITDVELSEGVRWIYDYSFYKISSVRKVDFPESLEKIGAYAFYGTSIEELHLPESLTQIGLDAFAETSALKSVYAKWDDPFNISYTTFYGVDPECCLYIPIGTSTRYKNAGWNFPKTKENGILSISVSEGGTVEYKNNTVSNGKELFNFVPYSPFEIKIHAATGYIISKVLLNGTDVTELLHDGIFSFEDPDQNYDIVVEFEIDNSHDGIESIFNDLNTAFDVYDINGIKVLEKSTYIEFMKLSPGLYIVNKSLIYKK